MNWILIAVVMIGISATVLLKLLQNRVTGTVDYPYQKIGSLFTSAERSFYGVLKQAVGEDAEVFGKVRVADVIAPRKGLTRSEWQKAFNKIAAKHFDFLVCSNDDLSIICAIELDDRSHQSRKRQQRDAFLKAVCDVAGVPLLQVSVKAGYVIDDVKALLSPHLTIRDRPIQEEPNKPQTSASGDRLCSKCASPMIIRVAKKGANAGKPFWACAAYPNCKQIEAINGEQSILGA